MRHFQLSLAEMIFAIADESTPEGISGFLSPSLSIDAPLFRFQMPEGHWIPECLRHANSCQPDISLAFH